MFAQWLSAPTPNAKTGDAQTMLEAGTVGQNPCGFRSTSVAAWCWHGLGQNDAASQVFFLPGFA